MAKNGKLISLIIKVVVFAFFIVGGIVTGTLTFAHLDAKADKGVEAKKKVEVLEVRYEKFETLSKERHTVQMKILEKMDTKLEKLDEKIQ